MAARDVRFFDNPHTPLLPDRLPRRGMSTVAALSSWLTHENHRENGSWSQTYRNGIPDEELRAAATTGQSGTCVTFQSDIPGPRLPTASDWTAFRWLHREMQAREQRP